jgi:aryl-alcohol dehydrogenase-like predicted oxidoreductase
MEAGSPACAKQSRRAWKGELSLDLRQLGNSDMRISPMGIGAWAMGGGGWKFGWGPQDDADSIAAIHKALDAGINWIDTAAVYGFGHSEEVVGRALAGRTSKPYVFTKCSRVWNERGDISGCLKRASLRREVEASLRRLKLDVIDLYQIHWPDPDQDIEEGWSTLAELKAEGKVRYIGVSNFNVQQMQRAHAISPITSLQPPYSLLSRGIEEAVLPFAAANNIGVIVYSPMKSGLLSGSMTRERVAAFPPDDFRRNQPDFQEPKLSRNLALADLLREVGRRHGRTAGEVAIAWTLRNPAVTAAIVGMRSAQQVDGVINAAWFRLTEDEAREIESFFEK